MAGTKELEAKLAKKDDVAFASTPDLHTAAHEAAHVVQQRAGVHLAGGVDQAGDPYEQHADAVADPASSSGPGGGGELEGLVAHHREPVASTTAPRASSSPRAAPRTTARCTLATAPCSTEAALALRGPGPVLRHHARAAS